MCHEIAGCAKEQGWTSGGTYLPTPDGAWLKCSGAQVGALEAGAVPVASIQVFRKGNEWSAVGRVVLGGQPYYATASTHNGDVCRDILARLDKMQPQAVAGLFGIDIPNPIDVVSSAVSTLASDIAHPVDAVSHAPQWAVDQVNAIAQTDIVKSVAQGLKDLMQSPYVAAAITAASAATGQPEIVAGYLAVRAAYGTANAIANGDPAAIANAAALATGAMGEEGKEAASLIASALNAPQLIKDKLKEAGISPDFLNGLPLSPADLQKAVNEIQSAPQAIKDKLIAAGVPAEIVNALPGSSLSATGVVGVPPVPGAVARNINPGRGGLMSVVRPGGVPAAATRAYVMPPLDQITEGVTPPWQG